MPCFSDESKMILVDGGKEEDHKKLEERYEELLKERVDYIEYGKPEDLSDKRQTQLNCDLLKQVLIHRAGQLMKSADVLLYQKNLHGLALVIRGHIETLAVIGYFTRRLDSLQKDNITFEQFQTDIANGLMGAKHSLFDKANAPVNILTCVEHTDKYLHAEVFGEKKKMVEDLYTWLSEFAHPNFCSNKSSFTLDRETGRMMLRQKEEISNDHLQMIAALVMSAELMTILLPRFEERKSAALPD